MLSCLYYGGNERAQRAIGGKANLNGGNERAQRAIGGKPNSTFMTVLPNTAGICWYYGAWRE